MLVGLTSAVPSCAVRLRLDCEIEGVGVDPEDPPLVWEAYTADGWVACDLDSDGTGGLNRAGEIVLHVPAAHESSLILNQLGGWLRCRVIEAYEGQPAYSASPRIRRCDADVVGGTATAVHAETIEGELLGLSEGVPAQRFETDRNPIVPGRRPARARDRRARGLAGVERGRPLRRLRALRRPLRPRCRRGRGRARAGGARARRHAHPARLGPAEGLDAAAALVPHRRRRGGQRRRAVG